MNPKKIPLAAAVIQPFSYKDEVTGDTISVSVSPEYSKLTINNREYFFIRETGEFDGLGSCLEHRRNRRANSVTKTAHYPLIVFKKWAYTIGSFVPSKLVFFGEDA